jgi:hypothetical protein
LVDDQYVVDIFHEIIKLDGPGAGTGSFCHVLLHEEDGCEGYEMGGDGLEMEKFQCCQKVKKNGSNLLTI